MYGMVVGGVPVDVARYTGVDGFGAATAQGCIAGASLHDLIYGAGRWELVCHGLPKANRCTWWWM
ncbi:MAG TPA: hypothetical protein VHK27_00510, partial [Gammaproteobacteria bacterium]|nr:hypothetical protein [Gammaproteobacteria bacterium]